MKQKLKASDIALIIGIILVIVGLWKLAERAFSPWWPTLSHAFSAGLNVIWPVAVILAGCLVIYAAKTGKIKFTGRLHRSVTDRRIGGVCGGIAECFGVESLPVRLIWVVLLIVSFGLAVLVYLLCWAIIPKGADPGVWR